MKRRSFLKSAAQTLLAAPALPLLDKIAEAQPTHPARHATRKAAAPARPQLTLNVRDHGATGDGANKDTLALQQTIERCSVFGGGEVLVPAGNYLTGALSLRSNVTLHIAEGATLNGSPDIADYPSAQVRWEGHWLKGYIGLINATDAENIALIGKGSIIGSPAIKVRVERPSGMRNPPLIEFINCRNVRVEDLTTEQFHMWSIHPVYCENVVFRNLSIKSGADGIDVDSCKHTVIDTCTFDTADDSISVKSGRGAEGNTIGRVCEDTLITACTLSDSGFACIGIGSETSGGIRNVRIEHCKFIHARSHAIYIKSRIGRGAFVEDISVTDCDVSDMRQGFLQIANLTVGISDNDASVIGMAGIPAFRNFRFSNIRVIDMPVLVDAVKLDSRKPLVGLTLANITGTCSKGISLANIQNAHLTGIKVTGFTGPLLSTANVTGTGLTGATRIDSPTPPGLFAAPTTPYQLK